MTISIEQGHSVSVPMVVTTGPVPTVDDTTAPSSPPVSGNAASVRVVYPDPTPGVANPARSIRIDAIGGTGANISYTCDGHNASVLVQVTPPVERGTASFGTPGQSFPTPAA